MRCEMHLQRLYMYTHNQEMAVIAPKYSFGISRICAGYLEVREHNHILGTENENTFQVQHCNPFLATRGEMDIRGECVRGCLWFKIAQQLGWGLNATTTSTFRSSSCAASHFSPSALLASFFSPSNPFSSS
jgi:hypothetical protein